MRGKLITLLARLAKGPKHRPPAHEHARMQQDGSVEIHGDGFTLRYCDPGEPLPRGLVPLRWLGNMGKQAGPRGNASFEPVPKSTRVAARVKTSTYGVDVCPAWDDFEALPVPDGAPVLLSLADWTPSGSVGIASAFASTDTTRPQLYGVYLGLEVAATDGNQFTRREAVSFMPALSGVLPLPAVHAMLKLIAETCPTDLVAHVGGHLDGKDGDNDRAVIFTARAAQGVAWRLSSRLCGGFPSERDRDQVMAGSTTHGTVVEVDVADLRELWRPLSSSRGMELAVYKDGTMLVWGDGDQGIGTTLSAVPTEPPVFTLGSATLPTIAKRLPKGGKVAVRSVAATCFIEGECFMQTRFRALPDYVHAALKAAFAAEEGLP